jgi:drug/metabolite transporter (DMT)-like permease
MQNNDTFKGAAFMSASMASFAINDTIIKFTGADIGVLQTIFVRGAFATCLMAMVAMASGAFRQLPKNADLKNIGFRTIAEIGATFCFLIALFNMPIANITAILQSLPLTVTLAAALFLGERISWQQSLAIIIGGLGVLIIIRPGGEGFNIFSLLGLVAVGFVTFRDLIVRKFSSRVSSLFVAFVTSASITLASGTGLLAFGSWTPMGLATYELLALAAIFIFLGYYFSVATMRHGKIALITPFRYTAVFWAVMLGWLVFDEIPDLLTGLGIGIILLSGLYTLSRKPSH